MRRKYKLAKVNFMKEVYGNLRTRSKKPQFTLMQIKYFKKILEERR